MRKISTTPPNQNTKIEQDIQHMVVGVMKIPMLPYKKQMPQNYNSSNLYYMLIISLETMSMPCL
jgi:hypothetical protein